MVCWTCFVVDSRIICNPLRVVCTKTYWNSWKRSDLPFFCKFWTEGHVKWNVTDVENWSKVLMRMKIVWNVVFKISNNFQQLNFLSDIIFFQLVSGSSGTQKTDEENNDTSDTDVGKGDGYTEGIPGPVTRLFVLANRGLANLVQDLILVRFYRFFCENRISYFFWIHRESHKLANASWTSRQD